MRTKTNFYEKEKTNNRFESHSAIFQGFGRIVVLAFCLLFGALGVAFLPGNVFSAENSNSSSSVFADTTASVYFNPNSTYNSSSNPYVGSDSNSGSSYTTPVLTLAKAYQILGGAGTIYFCKTLTISASTDIGWSERVTFVKFYDSLNTGASCTGSLITISSSVSDITVSFSNISFDGCGITSGNNGGAIGSTSSSNGITIDNCSFTGFIDSYGGVLSTSGELLVENSSFDSNKGTYGGAISLSGSNTATIINTLFVSNNSSKAGGAIYSHRAPLIVSNCNFMTNFTSSNSYKGGAIYLESGSLVCTDSTFSGNSAGTGGALFINDGSMSLDGCSFDSNSSYSYGGAVYAYRTTLTVASCDFTFNTATSNNGGAMFLENYVVSTITNSTFENNKCNSYGGAIYNYATNSSSSYFLNCTGCTFFANTATYGGAIYLGNGGGKISSGIFVDNSASYGGAVYPSGTCTVTFTSSVFTGNTPTSQDGSVYNSSSSSSYLIFTNCIFNSVYLNPNSIYDESTNPYVGSDSNYGVSIEKPVYSIDRALEILNGEGTIYLCNTLTIAKNTTLEPDSTVTIARYTDSSNANLSNEEQLLYVNSGVTLSISNMVFDGGNVSISASGGAIYNAGTLSVTNSVFKNNVTDINGSAIYSIGNVVCTNTSFQGNSPTGQSGAIYCSGTLTLSNCDFTKVVYLNPNSTYDASTNPYVGSDSNSGLNYLNPVLTLDKAYELLGGGGIIYFVKTLTISQNTSIGWDDEVTFKRYYDNNNRSLSNTGRLVYIGAYTVSFSNIIFDGNNVKIYNTGGLIYSESSSILTLSNCSFINSQSTYDGGAIYSNSALTVTDSQFTNNTGSYGGAIHSSSTITCSGTTFSNNSASVGGAIYGYSTSQFTDCNFLNNTSSSSGGAIYQISGTLTCINSNFTNNSGSYGGAIYYTGNYNWSIQSCNFTGNVVSQNGGAIYFDSSYILTVVDSSFTSNVANDTSYGGGAIYSSGSINSTDTYFVSNSGNTGGAIYCTSTLSCLRNDFNQNSPSGKSGAIQCSSQFLSDCNFDAIYLDATSGSDSNDGSSYSNSVLTLSKAITLLSSDGGTIIFVTLLTISANLSLDFDSSVTFKRYYNASNSSASNSSYLIYINSGLSVSFTNIIFDGLGVSIEISGGAIYNKATLTINDCTFKNFVTTGNGGTIYSTGTLSIDESDFLVNSTDSNGGAIYSTSNVVCASSNFTNNSATLGGAIYCTANLTCTNSVFEGNYPTGQSGAIYCGGTLDLTDSIFNNVVYFNPNGTYNADSNPYAGSDSNTGTLFSPVLTLSKAYELLGGKGVIYVCKTYEITSNTSIGWTEQITLKRYYDINYQYASNTSQLFTISSGATVTFTNVVIDGSQIALSLYGSAIYSDGTLTLDNCIVKGNYLNSSKSGGAIYSDGGSLTITDSSFYDNMATNAGGAIYIYNNGTLTISGSSFSNNTSVNSGGTIFVNGSSSVVVCSNSIFSDNTTTGGGGDAGAIYAVGQLTLTDCTFENNSIVGNSWGGAISCRGDTTITNSTFTNNSSNNSYGGAIYYSNSSGTLTINGGSFSDNYAYRGGAIYISGGTLNCYGSTVFNENTCSNNGGAIYSNTSYTSTKTITDAIFTKNYASQGGAIYNNGSLTLSGCTFTENNSGYGGAIFNYYYNSFITCDNSSFTGNYSNYDGGAVWLDLYSGAYEIHFTNSTFSNNYSKNGYGGAIRLSGAYTLYLTGDTFTGNSSPNYGGAIILYADSSLVVDTCSFLNNTGGSSGGAIKTNGKISVTDSTFTENYSGFAGGAVWVSLNDSSFTTFTFDGCTFTSNYANNSYSGAINLEGSTSNNLNIIDTQFTSNYSVSRGGAVYSSGTVTCTGETIFSKNSSIKGGAIYADGNVSCSGTTFSNNIPIGESGAIYCGGIKTLTNCTFTDINYVYLNYSSGSDSNSGLSPSYAVKTLSKAIEILGGSDGTIFLCSTLGITTDLILDYSYKITLKRYYSSSDSSNSNLNRLVTINSNLTVSISNIIFDASGYTTNSSGGAILINSGSTVTLTNCSIINSKSNGSGGAIYGNGNLTLNNCVISNNYSYDEGGAIRILSGGNLTVTDSVFENNTSGSYCSGGAIDITNSSFSCSNTNFVGNIASMYGGAIYFNSSSSYILTITDCTFSNNTSKSGYSGGAIYCYGILNCSGSTFTQNSTYSSNGGAIFFEGNFDSTIINNTFASNFSYNGGAIFFESQTNTLTITDCIFSDNKANYTTYCYGGAIYSNGNLVISGTSFTSNTSDYSGGAIYSTTTGIVTCTDSSFTSNTSVYSGGAIYSLLSVTCTRTIFRSNSPTGQSGAVYAKSLYLIDCEFNVVYLNPNSTYDATTNPYVGSDSNDGTSHTTPVLTLDKALELLGDEEGTITLCSTLYLTSSLTLDPDYTITFVRYYDDENESQSNMSNMIDISSGIIVQLSNIVFDGKAISLTTNGGSIFNKGKLVLSDCVFKANKTTGIGGAIYSLSGGTIYATNCSFLNNYATSGGAIYSTSNVTCTTTTFSGNRPNGQSGAIYCGRTLTLKNCEFSNVVYLNTNSTYNANTNYYPGSDSNDGTVNSPVLTLDKAYELLGGEGVIYFYNTLTISSSTTIGWTETVTFKRYYDANSLLSNTNSILYINSGVTATLSNIIFDGESTLMSASGGAIYNLGTLTITNCKFNYNYATVYGGAIYSLGEMNISYTSFLNNYAISYGGAIYCSENDLTLSHCTFSSNTGYSGGAIRIQKTTNDLTLSMTNCSFESNYASSSAGGAVYSQNATITGSDNSFLNNTSAKDGSAIYVNYALTTLTNCTFTGNVSNKTYTNLGGAILFYGSKDLTLTGCDFENNSGYKGSAVCLHTGSSPNSNKILITDCDFTDNTANYGGAIFSDFINSVTIDGCNFVSNSATNGGAIYKDYFSGITVKNSTFTENTSIYSGGAVYLTSNNSATFEGCTFTSNSSANYSGSAVYADSTETTFTNCNFYTNTNTSSGGALYLYASSSINGCIFDGNSSNFGGAIYVNDTSSTLTIVDSQFLNNVAGASGGALYLKNILSCSGTSFTGNYSTYCGGAICMYKDYSIEINACTFTKNTARYGGAIYSKGDVVCNTGTSFVSNTASISGGAIYALGDVSCTEVYFKGNFPRGREGAIYVSGVKTLTDCEFINIVYLNPQTGNDSNDGLGIGVNEDGSEAPLLTLQAAVDFLSDDGTIYLCGTLSISGDLTVGSNDYNIVIIRYYNADNESLSCTSRMFEISSDATVHFINTTIDGNADYSSDYTAITIADTATVYFDDNTVIQNCVSSGSGVTSGIVVSAGATLVLNGTQVLNTTYFFIANYGAVELNNVYAENYGWHFVASYSTATSLTMNNCTIKNGGRAISVFSSAIDIIIKNSYFYNCSIVADGGCLYIHSSSSVLIENCTFESCSSQGKAGGAIYITDCSNVTFTNCDFINNKAAGNYGAHIRILPTSNDGVYTFTNCTFTGGSAFTGGGISIFNENYYSNISIQGCTFDSIYGASSACIYVYASTLLISDSCFTNNRGGGESGIYGVITATMAGTTQSFIMTNTVVTGNVKDKNTVTDGDNMGGGVSVLFSSSDATATITGCVIDNNTCLGDNALGGGLYIANSEDGGTVTITDTSISGNYSAYNSGGAYIDLWSTNSLLTIEGCSFNNNVAEHNAGSISVGSRSSISSIEVNNSDFKYNNASNYSGGLFCYNSGSFSYLTFESNFSSVNCVLDFYQLGSTNKETLCDNLYLVSNTSNGSGALFDSTISTHKFIFTNCNFIDNSASGNGGAASLSGSGSASFTDCSFTNNSAYTGGAIWSIIPTTISNCSFIDNVSASYGGAIYLNSSAISTISNSIFDGNITKTGGGGGLFTWSSTSINDCVFKNNKAGSDGSGSGAGIALQGTNSVLNRVEISNNTVSNTGGGLYNYGSITILNNCNIYGNTAYNGGGVYVSSGSVTFNYCNIYGNTSGGAGGGIYTGSTTTLYYCNIYNNVANGTNYSGGAIYSTSYCNLSLSYCNIYGNSGAMRGGGIVLWDYATILNCNFYDNKALYVGGAICIIYGYQTQIQNCEFSNNSASYGSAIFVDNPITNSYEINFVIDGCSFISNKSTQGTIYSNFLLEITNCSFEDNISTTGAIIYSGNDKLNVPIGTTYYTDSSLTTVGGTTTVTSYCRVLNSTYCYGSLNLSGWTTVYFKTSDLIALEEETPGSVNIRTVTLTDCTITGNVSTSGGLVYMSSDNIFPAKLTMTGCTISGNSDGAGASLQVENYATANITDCVFTDNQGGTAVTTPDTSNGASGEVGGGVSVGTNATLNLTDCTFVSTIDENFVFAKADGTLNLTNTTVSAPNVVFTRGPIETAKGSHAVITGGTISGLTSTYGGALYIDGEAYVVDITIMANNYETKYGGGIYVAKNGNLTLNAIIKCNTTALGKGIYVLGTATMVGGEISGGADYGGSGGGGVYVANGGKFSMQKSESVDERGNTIISYGEIKNNYCGTGGGGGGIYIASGGTAVIEYGEIKNNYAYYRGGGIYVAEGGTLVTGKNALISGNYIHGGNTGSAYGMGVYNAGTMIMNGGTISGNYYNNSTSSFGGGIYSGANSTLTIKNATISNNRSYERGGGIFLAAGCVAYIENTIISGNRSADTQGGAIYATSGAKLTVVDSEISGNWTDEIGTIYIEKSEFTLIGSSVSNNSAGWVAGIYFNGQYNNLTIEDCIFEENIGNRQNSSATNLNVYIANKVSIKNSYFTNGYSAYSNASASHDGMLSKNSASVSIKNAMYLELIDCVFNGNVQNTTIGESYSVLNNGGALNIYGTLATQTLISGCTFENNIGTGKGGALSINIENADAVVNIIDSTFTGNQSVGYYDSSTSTWLGGCGGAIYLGGTATVNFSGDITVTDNLAGVSGGGIYVDSLVNFVIKKNAKMVVEDNFANCGTTTQTVTINSTDYSVTTLVQSTDEQNMFVVTRTSALSILEGDLADGSSIGVSYSSSGTALAGANDCIIKQADVEKLFSDNANYTFELDTTTNSVSLVGITSAFQVIANDLVYAKKNRTTTDDGKYGVTKDDLQFLNASGAVSVEFYSTSDGSAVSDISTITAWSETSARFGEFGSYIIYYRAEDDNSIVTGSLVLRIVGEMLYLETAPKATLKYGETLSKADFTSWSVVDEDGNNVTGTWAFTALTTIPTDMNTKYAVTFTPSRANYYEQTLATSIYVSIGYDIVFYKPSTQENAGGEFYTDVACTLSTSITTLGTMISYLNDGGTIVFMGTYQVGAGNNVSETISVSKTIYFVRHSSAITSEIIEILFNATENYLSLSAPNGEIVFEGAGQYTGNANAQAAAILNNGTLTIGNNVIFRNFTSQGSGTTGALGAVITNDVNGTLIFNGGKMYGNTATTSVSGGDNFGGAVYNAGEMIVNSGDFLANVTVGTGGKGGFVYNVGSLLINGGNIFANVSYYGGAIYVADGGSVTLSGGVLKFNTATASGGACYIASGGELSLNGTSIFSNRAGGEGAGVYSDGTLFNSTTGNIVSSSTVEELEEINEAYSDLETTVAETDSNNTLAMALTFAVLAVMLVGLVTLNEHRKRKQNYINLH